MREAQEGSKLGEERTEICVCAPDDQTSVQRGSIFSLYQRREPVNYPGNQRNAAGVSHDHCGFRALPGR